jgi:probable F420-dependent oxidoreductase
MRYGFSLPVRGELATYEGIVGMALHGERLGFHSATIADHVVFPTEIHSTYPYAATGVHPSRGDAIEQLSLMAFVAGKTERLRLVTSVMILPHRNPVLAAKMIASIDVVSRGRVTLGVGVGWLREEFEALRAPSFERRGAVSDEYIEILKKLWTTSPAEHSGTHYRFGPLRCEPRPVQRPHPPIWIGGHSRAALRRVARHGDGWHPLGGVETAPLPPEALARHLEELERLTEAEDRDFSKLTISFVGRLEHTRLPIPAAGRRPFSGSAEQIADDVAAYRKVGVSQISFDFRSPGLTETLERMDRFASDVMPLV